MLTTIWVDEEPERMVEFLSADHGVQGLIPQLNLQSGDLIEFVRAMMAHVQCNGFEVLKAIEQDDWLATTIRFNSVRRDTGAPVTTISMGMSRMQDGVLSETYNTFDFLAFFEALDLAPPNAVALCLSGQPLR